MKLRTKCLAGALALATAVPATTVLASSHREAPFIARTPKVDATDYYAFSSYEPGRAGYVTLIANYQPLQDAYGGPNYFTMDPDAIYEIHVDNDGDAVEDITFQFDFDTALANGGAGLAVPAGDESVAVPLSNIGAITAADNSGQNVLETYKLKVIRGDRRTGEAQDVTKVGGGATFAKPIDYIGQKSLGSAAAYNTYAASFIFNIDIPDCDAVGGQQARVFVGQRADGFPVNLGTIFDLVNAPAAVIADPNNRNAGLNIIAGKNVTSIAIEVPAACLNDAADTVFGSWTTASLRQAQVINPTGSFEQPSRVGGPWVQVSRLGMPLVNEVVIGLPDKDKFNGSEPKDDGQFATYVTNPSLATLLEVLFGADGVQAPTNFPRTDLVAAFLTGVTGVNGTGATLSEMLRLNTALGPTPIGMQDPDDYGAARCFDRTAAGGVVDTGNNGCDVAGFPNGRRPIDDVVDIELRVMMGYLAPTAASPAGGIGFVDGAGSETSDYRPGFPYLNTPAPGAVNF